MTDDKLSRIPANERVYNFESLKEEHEKVAKVISNIADELSLILRVETAKRYLSNLAKEDEKQIEDELRSFVDNDVNMEINFGEVAASLKTLFENLEKIQHYRLLYDASQIFRNIIVNYNEEQKLNINIDDDDDEKEKFDELLNVRSRNLP